MPVSTVTAVTLPAELVQKLLYQLDVLLNISEDSMKKEAAKELAELAQTKDAWMRGYLRGGASAFTTSAKWVRSDMGEIAAQFSAACEKQGVTELWPVTPAEEILTTAPVVIGR